MRTTILPALLVLVLLAVLNPKQADFRAYLASRASAQASGSAGGGLIGAISKGAGAVAGGAASIVGGAFKRADYLIFSTYSAGASGPLYLGVAKLFFKLR